MSHAREDILSLADCPFCGGRAMECHVAEPSIQCERCPVGMVGETEAEAANLWNRRAAPTPPAAEAPGQEPVAVSSHDLIKRLGGDPDAPFEVGAFPPEMREASPYLASPTYADAEAKGFEPVFRERPTHNVWRVGGAECLPCHCWADRDHTIGAEVKHYTAIRSFASPAPKGET